MIVRQASVIVARWGGCLESWSGGSWDCVGGGTCGRDPVSWGVSWAIVWLGGDAIDRKTAGNLCGWCCSGLGRHRGGSFRSQISGTVLRPEEYLCLELGVRIRQAKPIDQPWSLDCRCKQAYQPVLLAELHIYGTTPCHFHQNFQRMCYFDHQSMVVCAAPVA